MYVQRSTIKAHEDAAWSVRWVNDTIVTGSVDERVRVWSAADLNTYKDEFNNQGEKNEVFRTRCRVHVMCVY